MTFASDQKRDAYIAALVRERDMYAAKGDTAAVRQVDAQLRLLGVDAERPVEHASRRPASKRHESR